MNYFININNRIFLKRLISNFALKKYNIIIILKEIKSNYYFIIK